MIPKQVQEKIDEVRELIKYSEDYEFQEELMDLGNQLEEYPKEQLVDENKLKGCISIVYIYGVNNKNKIHYYAYSNSGTVKGFLYLLMKMFNDLEKEEITSLPDDILDVLSLDSNSKISQSRLEGFKKAFFRIKEIAKNL